MRIAAMFRLPQIPSSRCSRGEPARATMHVALASLFMAVLWLPLVCTGLGCQERVRIMEVRRPPVKPVFEKGFRTGYVKAWLDYFEDTFAYRLTLARFHGLVLAKGLGVSPSNRVLIGQDDWLFFTGSRKIEDFQGLDAPSANELESWRQGIGGREAWLRERGIGYLFVLVPNKISIHPGQAPDPIRVKGPTTRIERLSPSLKRQGVEAFLDLRPTLRRAAETELVYYEMGTHWNHAGAYIGYVAVCRRLAAAFPALVPLERQAFRLTMEPGESINRMMALQDTDIPAPPAPHLRLPTPSAQIVPTRVPEGFPPGSYSMYGTMSEDRSGTVLILHDSFFADFMQKVFPEHFGRTIWYRRTGWLDHQRFEMLVDAFQPDVVIDESVERFMTMLPPDTPAYAAALRASAARPDKP